LQARRRQTASK